MNLPRLIKPDETLLEVIRAYRTLCYLKLKRLLEKYDGTDEQKRDLEKSNQRFIEKGL